MENDIQARAENVNYLLSERVEEGCNVIFRPYLPNNLLEVKGEFWNRFCEDVLERLKVLATGIAEPTAIDRFVIFMLEEGYMTTYRPNTTDATER